MPERINPMDEKPPVYLPTPPDKKRRPVEKPTPVPPDRRQPSDTVEISEAARELLERDRRSNESGDTKEHLE